MFLTKNFLRSNQHIYRGFSVGFYLSNMSLNLKQLIRENVQLISVRDLAPSTLQSFRHFCTYKSLVKAHQRLKDYVYISIKYRHSLCSDVMDFPLCKFCHTYAERFYSQRYYIMNEIKDIGIGLAKSVFQVCVRMSDGNIASNRKVSRAKWLDTIRQFPLGSMIAMEGYATSHYWGRTFLSTGFQVRLIPTLHVKALTHHQKNEANDALAICETAFRPGIHFVAIKTVEQ